MTACEGETTYTKTITNNNTDTVSMSIYSQWEYMEDSIFLLPKTSKIIYISSNLGGTDTPMLCTTEFDSIFVSVSGDKVLKINIMDNDNWTYRINSNRNGSVVDHYCNFEIKDGDIE